MGNLLDSRRERTQMMNTKVLESWGEEEPDMGNGVGGETAAVSVERRDTLLGSVHRGEAGTTSAGTAVRFVFLTLIIKSSPLPSKFLSKPTCS